MNYCERPVTDGIFQEIKRSEGRNTRTGKIAFVTPMPPERSGIAAYAAELLSAFDDKYRIDVYSDDIEHGAFKFPIYPWQEFETKALTYDLIVYQLGNSAFHWYMLDMMLKYPGLVVLHDFFLSDLMNYMSAAKYRTMDYIRQMLYASHEVICVDSDIGGMVERYPINKMVFDFSQGVIFHSAYCQGLYERFYPSCPHPPFYIVPLIRGGQKEIMPEDKRLARRELGIDEECFLAITLGIVSRKKLPHIFLEAGKMFLSEYPDSMFIYVGDGIETCGLDVSRYESIRSTGYVTDELYEKYIMAADVAVQLRSGSRGETSKAVLDCMSFGVPVILNDYATFKDYPDDVVCKLSEVPAAAELKNKLAELKQDEDKRRDISVKSQKYLRSYCSPDVIREKYYDCIEKTIKSKDVSERGDFIRECGKKLKSGEWDEEAIKSQIKERFLIEKGYVDLPVSIENKHASPVTVGKMWLKYSVLKPVYLKLEKCSPSLARLTKRTIYGAWHKMKYLGSNGEMRFSVWPHPIDTRCLFVDLTLISFHDARTGIQRVVNNVVSNMLALAGDVVPARDFHGHLITANAYMRNAEDRKGEGKQISFMQGDRLLLLDSSWVYKAYWYQHIKQLQHANGKVAAVIYDFLPFQYPEMVFDDEGVRIYKDWHKMILEEADDILCISKTVADNAEQYYQKLKIKRDKELRLHYFPMGAEIKEMQGEPRRELRDFVSGGTTFFMVGTIEPRKCHKVALEAFAKLIEKNSEAKLLIVGKDGWKNKDIIKMMGNPSFEGRLLWLQDVGDSELQWVYRNASALIAASRDEGYGLPLIEAAYFGTPIIASDIPVFHEVAGDHVDYFKVMDSDALCAAMLNWIAADSHPDSRQIRLYTWQESAQAILDIINEKQEPYKVLS